MSNIPEITVDYLQIPIGRRPSTTRSTRTAPLINSRNESTRSLTSLRHMPPITTNLSKHDSSLSQYQRPSASISHLETLLDDDNNDQVVLVPISTKQRSTQSASLPSVIENPLETLDAKHVRIPFMRMPSQRALRGLLPTTNWSNPFAHGRTNDENADAYKMFSILYGLVIFLGGVAFSISHAIIPEDEAENIKHFAEIYFTYLYCVSICWIIFCILDIVRHRKKINMNRGSAKDFELNFLPRPSTRLRVSKTKQPSSPEDDAFTKLASTPHFNLQLFDDSEDSLTEANDKNTERRPMHHDDGSDEEHARLTLTRSHSLDQLSTRSSLHMRRNTDQTRDVLTRRHALDPGGVNNLRSYMRHRKNSIVQRVIGYNYDDNSTAGGLYIRVGIGIFCLGTVIHSGLAILSNLENVQCVRWTAVMDDSSRLLFCFIQFFFIFKHSNLIIRAHESFARLAVMHVVVTNLCVWFRMVVIETKSQIVEIGAHEATSGSITNFSQAAMHALGHGMHQIPLNCLHLKSPTQPMTVFVQDGYMRLKPLLYPCTIEFSLMCLTLFFLIWENIGKTFSYQTSDRASTKNVFMVNCHASIKGLFGGMIVFSCTVISIILYAVFRNKIGEEFHMMTLATTAATLITASSRSLHLNPYLTHGTSIINTSLSALDHHEAGFAAAVAIAHPSPGSGHGPFTSLSDTPKRLLYSIAIVEIVNACLLITSLLATTWALIKIRKLHYRRTTTRFDDVLIIVSLTGTYLYTIFSAFALLNNKYQLTWIAYLKIIICFIEFAESTIHAFFILIALRKRLQRTSRHEYPAREVLTLLIMVDLSLWFEETTTTTKHEANPFQLAFYHTIPWSIIAAIATPLQIFFRFHASVCLSHVWENMYVLPTYEPVAPHGL